MKLDQLQWSASTGWIETTKGLADGAQAGLVLFFGASQCPAAPQRVEELRQRYPRACLCGCSTAGEIAGVSVLDDSVVAVAVEFADTTVRHAVVTVDSSADSFSAGAALAAQLPRDGLNYCFVLSDGQIVNGTELINGIHSYLGAVTVTGGLAGDGTRFQETCVCANGRLRPHQVVLLGFYGSRLRVGYGSLGGWDSFGPERRVTRSRNNVLYELDGRSALALYKQYLGPHAAGLPASGLLFPLCVRMGGGNESVVRTILGVREQDQSMTFAGDVPEGSIVRLMRANTDRLVDGAAGAADGCRQRLAGQSAELAILISCVGRRLVLKQRTEEELEAVANVLGPGVPMIGYYSYGEISPLVPEARCVLHNQTMTITTLGEG